MPDLNPNPGFDLLHPRARQGAPNAGEFVDVMARLQSLGGEYDKPRGIWLVPAERRADFESLLNEVGFDAVDVPHGMRPASDADRTRLGVPPAWTNVMVSTDPNAKLVVQGRDAQGRVQSRYSKAHMEAQAAEKFERIRQLAPRLPAVDSALSDQAAHDDTAAAMMLVRKMGLRPGSNKDTKAARQAFGASTLERRHVQVKGDVVWLKFTGKSGKDLDLEIEDAELAKVLKPRLEGKRGTDRLFDTNALQMNRWVKTYTGDSGFKVKDFRTARATAEAKAIVANTPVPKTKAEAKSARRAVATQVSALLGNTPTIALESYIDPTVFGPWEELL